MDSASVASSSLSFPECLLEPLSFSTLRCLRYRGGLWEEIGEREGFIYRRNTAGLNPGWKLRVLEICRGHRTNIKLPPEVKARDSSISCSNSSAAQWPFPLCQSIVQQRSCRDAKGQTNQNTGFQGQNICLFFECYFPFSGSFVTAIWWGGRIEWK